MKKTDLVIDAGTVVTVDAKNRLLHEHSLVIEDGRIIDILPTAAAKKQYEAREYSDCSSDIVMPGLVNAHTHLPMNMLRGFADDLPLMTWLEQHIWPVEKRLLDEETVAIGTRHALAESLLGGVTCCNDMYFFPDVVAREAVAAGCRAVVGMLVLDFPSVWAKDATQYLQRGLDLRDTLRDEPLVNTAFAPHAPYTVSAGTLEKVVVLSSELDVPVHMHVHETAKEVSDYESEHGCRPLQKLDELGLLTPSLLAVHMTQLLPAEIDKLSTCGVHVLHCPESNMKLASGVAPITELLKNDVNVAIGTDGAASNNDLDMFGEMRSASLLAKSSSSDAASVPAREALRMSTINGARALGLANETGSLEPGKFADVIRLDCQDVNMSPVYNIESHIVFATGRQAVRDVWVAGQHVVKDRGLTTLEQTKIISDMQQLAERAGRSA